MGWIPGPAFVDWLRVWCASWYQAGGRLSSAPVPRLLSAAHHKDLDDESLSSDADSVHTFPKGSPRGVASGPHNDQGVVVTAQTAERPIGLVRRGTLRRRRARKLSAYAKKLGLEVVFTPVPSPKGSETGTLHFSPPSPPSSVTSDPKSGVVEVSGCCV